MKFEVSNYTQKKAKNASFRNRKTGRLFNSKK